MLKAFYDVIVDKTYTCTYYPTDCIVVLLLPFNAFCSVMMGQMCTYCPTEWSFRCTHVTSDCIIAVAVVHCAYLCDIPQCSTNIYASPFLSCNF